MSDNDVKVKPILAPSVGDSTVSTCSRLWQWVFPRVSEVPDGSLWLARKTFYKERYSGHDLEEVSGVTSSNSAFVTTVPHGDDWNPIPSLPIVRRPIRCVGLGWLMRRYRKVTREEAKGLGFRTDVLAKVENAPASDSSPSEISG